ncbi:arsenical-resistance protein ACR3 [Daldinia caldariorum]|uniref:arsenical-resistance protein ACR3 n=1 Tax=Daldinia caldariorum TaxID=326644 RepID=UPI00200787A1|nr:arsenical-resistance protein ACR3 [Daldinia caldariorum]KAI1470304.1 arsenical-resistance protein ACR3 [Daldinia caldariorum]
MESGSKSTPDLNAAQVHVQIQPPPSDNDTEKGRQANDQLDDDAEASPKQSAFKSLGWLDRFLAIWIFLAMAVGIILGNFVPGVGDALQKGQFVGVSVPIAVGLLVMMYPILCKVRYETLHEIFSHRGVWKQIAFSVFVNWIVAPFLMLALAWACLPDKPELRTGLILVGLGRCIAMVLIWTGLAGGDSEYCAILVAINSILQMVLFAPLAVFFIRVISRESGPLDISYEVVATSVGTFLGIPLGAAMVSRFGLRALAGPQWYDRVFLKFIAPWSLIGLLYTILVLFAYQGQQVVHQIVSVLRVAVPLIVYFVVIFFLTLWATYRCGFGYALGATQSFTAASNNFELAIAVAVATYGPNSDQALASTVGPLIEVPVLLGLVYVVKAIGGKWGWKD